MATSWNPDFDDELKMINENVLLSFSWRKMGGVEGRKDFFRRLSKALGSNSSLQSLFIEGESMRTRDCKRMGRALRKNSSVTSVSFCRCEIDDRGLEELCKRLKLSQSLLKVHLCANLFTEKGCEYLSACLDRLQRLSLEECPNATGPGLSTLLRSACRQLQEVCLVDFSFSMSHIQDISHALMQSDCRLSSLEISQIPSAACAQAICNALSSNQSVTRFALSGEMIGDSAAKDIAELLKMNENLRHLSCSNCGFQDFGADLICDAADNLCSLDLSNNDICRSSGISKMLLRSTNLRSLDLQYTVFVENSQALQSFVDAVCCSPSLLDLNLYIPVDASDTHVQKILSTNRRRFKRVIRACETMLALCKRWGVCKNLAKHVALFVYQTRCQQDAWLSQRAKKKKK